jgi:hypothetical protein
MADEPKKAEEKKSGSTLVKVLATVFGAVLAPVLVGVIVKWADPSLWRSTQGGQPTAPSTAGPGSGPQERPACVHLQGGTELFNGKDLAGWGTADGKPGGWRVEGGQLTCGGPPSYLYTTANDWADFHLRAEAKINHGGNSGIFFRVNRPLKIGEGYEAQIENGTDRYKTGSLHGLVQVDELLVLPDTWFTLDVIARGPHIQVLVDHKKVVDYTDGKNNRLKGHIALQHHNPQTRVFFRKIEIKKLP